MGADFSDLQGISVFGAFARVVRLNHISAKGYYSAFGLRNRRNDDLFRRLTFSGISRSTVARALSLTSKATLDIAPWLPFQFDPEHLKDGWSFRYCPSCLRQGFHSLLHQLPWIDRCPWHATRLLAKCAICASSLALNADARRPLLTCPNGHDIFNETVCCATQFDQAANAAKFIDDYLAWAELERVRCILIPPEAGTTPFDVLGSVIMPPPTLLHRSRGTVLVDRASHARTLTLQPKSTQAIHDRISAIAKLSTLCNDVSGLELPPELAPGFINIGWQLANRLPPESLTDSEISLFFDGLTRQPDQTFKPAKRSPLAEIRFLPPLLIGERRVIHRSTLSKIAIRAAERLLAASASDSNLPDSRADVSRHLLLRALSAILTRAYAEGMRVVLSRYIPTLFDSKRDRPRLTEPWVLAWKEGQQLHKVTIVWPRRKGLP